MTELKDERALPIALEWTKRGKSNPVRGAATLALGKLGQLSDQAKDDAYDRLVELLPDEWLRVRLNAIAALAELKLPKAVGELERVARPRARRPRHPRRPRGDRTASAKAPTRATR